MMSQPSLVKIMEKHVIFNKADSVLMWCSWTSGPFRVHCIVLNLICQLGHGEAVKQALLRSIIAHCLSVIRSNVD